MEVAFDSKELRTICEVDSAAERELGANVAEALRHRLADLRAASSVDDLVVGSPHALEGTEAHFVAIALRDGYRVVLSANHPRNPETQSGNVDWSRVSRVKVMRIDAGHE